MLILQTVWLRVESIYCTLYSTQRNVGGTFALHMGSNEHLCPKCAVKFHYVALFPKGNKTKWVIQACTECLISAAHTAANCPPAGLRVKIAMMKQEMHKWGLEWNQSARSAVHTCAYRLNITWWESSWNMKWRGRVGNREKEKRGGGECSKAVKQWGGVRKGGGEGKKQVWSGKPVQLSGQNSTVDIFETDQRRLEKNKHESTRKDGSDGTSHSSVFPRGNKGD